jgi:hypothetical protein
MAKEIKQGDRIIRRYGPYETLGTVVSVTDRGAVVALDRVAHLIGFGVPLDAPDGTQLTADPHHDFIGKAHLHGVTVVE